VSLWRKRAGNIPDEIKQNMENKGAIVIGNYALWNLNDEDSFGITFIPTGEMGVFHRADFEAYVKGFFGLNF
jgi:hypothetical protein